MFEYIDLYIFAAFLILNIIVGVTHTKKIKTIKDFALGGRNFDTQPLLQL